MYLCTFPSIMASAEKLAAEMGHESVLCSGTGDVVGMDALSGITYGSG